MDSKYSQVPLSYLEPIFSTWLSFHTREEVGNVFFLPKGDLMFRALQYQDWVKTTQGLNLHLIDSDADLITNPENLDSELRAHDFNQPVVLIAKKLFCDPDGQALASIIQKWYAQSRGILILHEGMPSEMKQFVSTPCMYQSVNIYKLYPPEVAIDYVKNVEAKWNYQINPKIRDEVCLYTGGFPWLINDVIRSLIAQPNIDLDSCFNAETFKWKVNEIIKSLSASHQEALFKPNQSNLLSSTLELVQFGLINEAGQAIPCIQSWIQLNYQNSFKLTSTQIVINNQDITLLFSPSERTVLFEFYQHRHDLFTRDQVASWFWGHDWHNQYSDWALDQFVSRLRKKLVKHHLPLQIITKKGLGYVGK